MGILTLLTNFVFKWLFKLFRSLPFLLWSTDNVCVERFVCKTLGQLELYEDF